MKILSKIKAFFRFQNQDAELEVSAAEIKNGKVFLHPKEDKSRIYCVKSDNVDIFISPRTNICEDDVEIIEFQNRNITKQAQDPAPKKSENRDDSGERERKWIKNQLASHTPVMKTVQLRLYPDEYEMLMTQIQENGYKKTEFLLACVSAAKKHSMEANYKKYDILHQQRRAESRRAAKAAREQARSQYH